MNDNNGTTTAAGFSSYPALPLAERYLRRAVTAGASERLQRVLVALRGTLRLAGGWRPFRSELQVEPGRGFEWRARLRLFGLPVTGFDRYRGGAGEMRWRLVGVVPLVHAASADVTRSARHRAVAETVFCPAGQRLVAAYSETDDGWLRVEIPLDGERVAVELCIDAIGDVTALRMQRWGDPDNQGVFALHPFGATLTEPRDFGGVVIPTQIEAGWHPGAPRFASEGAFFRARVTGVRPAPDLAKARSRPECEK